MIIHLFGIRNEEKFVKLHKFYFLSSIDQSHILSEYS